MKGRQEAQYTPVLAKDIKRAARRLFILLSRRERYGK